MLWALLFSIYINDLSAVSETCSSACYIDDTKLILSFTVEESHTTAVKINDDLQLIRDWCFENFLVLNPDDTKLMVFGSPQTICKPLSFSKLSFLGKECLLSKIQTPLKACDNFRTRGSAEQNRSVLTVVGTARTASALDFPGKWFNLSWFLLLNLWNYSERTHQCMFLSFHWSPVIQCNCCFQHVAPSLIPVLSTLVLLWNNKSEFPTLKHMNNLLQKTYHNSFTSEQVFSN